MELLSYLCYPYMVHETWGVQSGLLKKTIGLVCRTVTVCIDLWEWLCIKIFPLSHINIFLSVPHIHPEWGQLKGLKFSSISTSHLCSTTFSFCVLKLLGIELMYVYISLLVTCLRPMMLTLYIMPIEVVNFCLIYCAYMFHHLLGTCLECTFHTSCCEFFYNRRCHIQ